MPLLNPALLGSVILLEFLRLLRMTLLHLLFLHVIVVLGGRLLMFFLLLLLELLVILRLLSSKFVLLLLVFLVVRSVPGIWRREGVRLQIARVIRLGGGRPILRARASCSSSCGIGWRGLVFAACFPCRYSTLEIARPGSGRDRRLALVGRSA